jgi:diaminohydroxyphosphoribosylaminopyrimidine deaminase/5-amino-6-(5-phosphoribosylamino)uracil reductase
VARESQWITSEQARERSLALREEFDAILIGSGTVRTDNPRLTRRLGLAGARPWTRVVLDGSGEVPPQSQVLTDGGRTILFTSSRSSDPRDGVEIVPVDGRPDLGSVLGDLYARGIQSVIVEGGAQILSAFIRQQLWQKMILFVAPMVVGGGEAPAIFDDAGVSRLTEAHRFRFDRVEFVGSDLMIAAYPT